MVIVNTVTEAKARLSSLIQRVQEGEEIVIGRAGKPVAVLVSYGRRARPRKPGAMRGRIRISKDFDELPADLAAAFGMEKQ